MASSYYGNDTGSVVLAPQVFTGAGSATFTLNPRIGSAQVFINKILQVNNFTITGNTLTMDAVVAAGAEVVVIPRSPVGRTDTTNYRYPFADQDGSSTTAYSATYSPIPTALNHNIIVGIKTLYANTGTATFTPNLGTLTAKPIVNAIGAPLVAGVLPVNSSVLLRFDVPSDSWWIVNQSGVATSRSAITGPSLTFTTELLSNASMTYSMTANTTFTAPASSNVPQSGAWYIDITVNSTGGYTLTFTNSGTVTWNQVYGFSFDCVPSGVYRLWLVARGSTIIDVSIERLV